tara:strand:+ start:684 stop:1079 length:396 start_codon:yes stop_codon:yes gene_type:complete
LKPYEIYGVIEHFDKLINDERFTLEARAAMGREYLNSLPPASLNTSSASTHNAVREYVITKLNSIHEVIHGAERNTKSKVEEIKSQPSEKTSVDKAEQTPAPDNTDEAGGRTKVAKAPSNAKKRGRKKSSA